MSSPKTHFIQSIATSALLYPAIGENVIPFGLAVIFIDLDHVIAYVKDTNSLDIRGFFPYFDFLLRNVDNTFLGLNVFHTIECYGLLLYLGTMSSVFYYILLGFLYHHLIDQWELTIRRKMPFVRAYSVFEYLLRKKNGKCRTSIRDIIIFSNNELNLTGETNLRKWLVKWGVNLKPNNSG